MKNLLLSTILMAVSLNAFSQWSPIGDKIKTSWATQIDPENVLPEYPRPQMVRPIWLNLNGLWNYSITPESSQDVKPQGQILVPFAVESSLSGVGKTLGKTEVLWYERTFTIPKNWKGNDIMLHFGAIDWQADVWVNNQKVGQHTGGYTPFSFNITPYLKKGQQTLKIRVLDHTDAAWQPRGKQVTSPRGIWYTSVSGIWQTVWLEPVAKTHIENYYIVSDIENNKMRIKVEADELVQGDKINFQLIQGSEGYSTEKPGTNVIAQAFLTDGKAEITVPDMKTWSPSSPYLYGVKISIIRGKKVIDCIDGYTAMRQISMKKSKTIDGNSYQRMALNGKNLFQMGPLDQGWWPDGLYTAPTDEALKYDIQKTKDWGFNMIRKHIKVEPARWFYYCDQLGLLVWQDMPCIADHSYFRHHKGVGDRDESLRDAMTNVWIRENPTKKGTDCIVPQQWKDNYYKEWKEIIESTKNFQCIVVWVPFNEAWGQFDTEKVVEFTRQLDPTRLVNEASGGNFHYVGDIVDCHHYPNPAMHDFHSGLINVLGEYGGIGYPEKGHLWQNDANWGYNGVKKNHDDVTATYEQFAQMLKVLARTGFSAAVYTQTTDVEGEVNGIMTYDRKIIKMNEARLREANQSIIRSIEE